MNLNFSIDAIHCFMVVLLRLSGLAVVSPLFSNSVGSARVKSGLILLLALFISTTLPPAHHGKQDIELMPLVGEFMIGNVLGFGFRLAYSAATMAGEIAGLQMGLGAASLIDANSGQSAALLESFYGMLFTVMFISLDGHHHMLRIFRESFIAIPAAGGLRQVPVEMLIAQSGDMIGCGLRLAAPVVIPLMLLTVSMALVSRAFPQANIYSISYGVSMLAGMMFLAAATPGLRDAFGEVLHQADRNAVKFIHVLAG